MNKPASILKPAITTRRSEPTAEEIFPSHSSGATEILDDVSFRRMISLERKRAERSGRRFVLMILESTPLLKAKPEADKAVLLQKVLAALSQATRETDLKGWYESAFAIGVIFTEIGAGDGNAIANGLLTRTTTALSATLGIENLDVIKLSFHIFPAPAGHDGPGDTIFYPDGRNGKPTAQLVKRAMDIMGSLLALIILSPLLFLIALLIKLTSAGPVLFRQKRVGRYGKPFTFLKFRSMYFGNDDSIHRKYVMQLIAGGHAGDGNNVRKPVYKMTNDPRVTRLGRFLRRTSLDELPQFYNVLIGNMSLVGPRPPIPYEYEKYNLWHRRRLFAAKPGVTGLWQVAGRSKLTFDEMVRLDLKYATTWSLWLDILILLRTPHVVITGAGGY
jgi:lipopolysaccharide/colanic/teichoic acid biosynthesis glycosyltransferase